MDIYRTAMMVRLGLSEGGAILAFALSFVVASPLPYYAAVVPALVALWWHTWPSDGLVRRVDRRLDHSQGPTHLEAAMATPHDQQH